MHLMASNRKQIIIINVFFSYVEWLCFIKCANHFIHSKTICSLSNKHAGYWQVAALIMASGEANWFIQQMQILWIFFFIFLSRICGLWYFLIHPFSVSGSVSVSSWLCHTHTLAVFWILIAWDQLYTYICIQIDQKIIRKTFHYTILQLTEWWHCSTSILETFENC